MKGDIRSMKVVLRAEHEAASADVQNCRLLGNLELCKLRADTSVNTNNQMVPKRALSADQPEDR